MRRRPIRPRPRTPSRTSAASCSGRPPNHSCWAAIWTTGCGCSSRPRAERLLRQVRGLVDRVPPHHRPDAEANIHVTTGMLAFLSGRWKTAAIELCQAEQMFREQSALPYKLVVVQVYTLNALYY